MGAIINPPDIDPSNNGTLAGLLRFSMKKFMQNVDGMLPAQVMSYDRDNNRVQVQVLIQMVTTGGQKISRFQLAQIPVLILGGGNLFISFPLKTGDLGWILANDNDISLFLQTYTETPPNTPRVSSFSDAMFIPDIMHDYTINDEDTDSMVISNLDGTVRIAISEEKVTITSPGVTIMSPTVHINGDLAITGAVTASGSITSDV